MMSNVQEMQDKLHQQVEHYKAKCARLQAELTTTEANSNSVSASLQRMSKVGDCQWHTTARVCACTVVGPISLLYPVRLYPCRVTVVLATRSVSMKTSPA
jgi:hypothetical protein